MHWFAASYILIFEVKKIMLVSNVYMLCMLSTLKLTQLFPNVLKSYTISLYDLGYPNISCIIGNFNIDKALLDLGASVNLLPYSTY